MKKKIGSVCGFLSRGKSGFGRLTVTQTRKTKNMTKETGKNQISQFKGLLVKVEAIDPNCLESVLEAVKNDLDDEFRFIDSYFDNLF